MTKFVDIGDTIEAEHADAVSRVIKWKGLKAHPVTKDLMMLYECDRNSFIEATKVCSPFQICECQIGDQLEADAISVYIKTKRKLRTYVKEGISGRHGAQLMDIRNRSISTIKTPLPNLMKCLGVKRGVAGDKNILINKE